MTLNERVLIILDNYDVEDDPNFEELANLPCHLLITSRIIFDDYKTLPITAISDFDIVRKLFLDFWKKDLIQETLTDKERSAIDDILLLVQCHTITVELIAKQMKASRISPSQMLEILRTNGLHTSLPETVRYGNGKQNEASFDIIRSLFRLSGLDESCITLLRCMTVVPLTGIKIKYFKKACQLDSYNTLNWLIEHSWLIADGDEDNNTDQTTVRMHPVIADIVREECRPTIDNCSVYINGLLLKYDQQEKYKSGVLKEVDNLWFSSPEERVERWALYEKVLIEFPEPNAFLWKEYGRLCYNAWICGRFQLAVNTALRLLAFVEREFPDDKKILAYAETILGGCYYNSGDNQKAENCYRKGLEDYLSCYNDDADIEYLKNLVSTYLRVGRCDRLNRDYTASRDKFEKAIDICTQHPDEITEIADVLHEFSLLCIAEGNYKEGLKRSEDSLKRYQHDYNEECPGYALAYLAMGKCNMYLENYTKAEKELKEALRITTYFHGSHNFDTYLTREALIEFYKFCNKHEEAERLFSELFFDAELDFGKNSSYLVHLKSHYPYKIIGIIE